MNEVKRFGLTAHLVPGVFIAAGFITLVSPLLTPMHPAIPTVFQFPLNMVGIFYFLLAGGYEWTIYKQRANERLYRQKLQSLDRRRSNDQ
jgi:hypothetical protein